MSVKTYTCCDICNTNGYITVDRRDQHRGDSVGRRENDRCSWFEGMPDDSTDSGWIVTSKGKHVCPKCYQHHKEAVFSI